MVVEDAERLPVLRAVERPSLLVAVEDLDDVGRQRGAQPPGLDRPLLHAGQRRAQHEARETAVAAQRVLERELTAPRRAEEMDPLELELVAQRGELVEEDLDAPVDVLRAVRAATADLVVEDDGAAVSASRSSGAK